MSYIFLRVLVLALQLETWCLLAYEGSHVGTLLHVFRRKGSFIKVFHQSKLFYFYFFIFMFMCVWALSCCWDVVTVERGFSLIESSVFCCSQVSDWRCSSICATVMADPPATAVLDLDLLLFSDVMGSVLHPSQLHQLFIKLTQLVVFTFVLTTC